MSSDKNTNKTCMTVYFLRLHKLQGPLSAEYWVLSLQLKLSMAQERAKAI